MTIKSTAILFLALWIFRSFNTFLIQSYFDPDEYWQSLEPAYCEVFGNQTTSAPNAIPFSCAGYTWEWRRRAEDSSSQSSWLETSMKGPIRSYFSVLPVYLFYKALQVTRFASHFWVSQGPKLLYALLAAAPTDLSVWIMARWLSLGKKGKWSSTGRIPDLFGDPSDNMPWWCLLCSITSWFHAYTLTRTFSNSLEAMLLAVSMALISPEFLGGFEGVPRGKLRHACCFFLGGLSVSLRFTSVLAWIPMGMILSLQSRWTWIRRVDFLIRTCAIGGILGIAVAAIFDRLWYGFWAIPFLGSFHFNVILSNATLYGSHPWHWYLTAGIPVITGLLFPLLVWDFFMTIFGRMKDARRNVWLVIVVFTFFHCFSGHKEFRFLLPLLPLFCLVAGSKVQALILRMTGQRSHGSIWGAAFVIAVPNLFAVMYLGLFHQSAPISVNHKIAEMVAASSASRHLANSQQPTIYSVHYLTGGCHSTPLHSYLHVPDQAVVWDTWSLDCSPSCRSGSDISCESEQFRTDPAGFVQEAYSGSGEDESCMNDSGRNDQDGTTCSAYALSRSSELPARRVKKHPDFVVTFTEYTAKIQPQLSVLGLKEIARYPHGINGLRIGTLLQTGDGYLGSGDVQPPLYRRVTLLGDFLEITVDEMVLYASSTAW